MNGFFKWCAEQGDALPKDAGSICEKEFVRIRKRKRPKRADGTNRRVYEDSETKAIFGAAKFTGCKSKRNWKERGSLVYRDHRYWMTCINALHGNRREEPAILKVKHVKRTATGIWYFHWAAPELGPLLKDIGSPRDVPLHETLISLGFLETRVHGRDPEAPLFPEAFSHSAMARHAQPYGSWFGLFCDDCGVCDPALDTHAWRHTAVTKLLLACVRRRLSRNLSAMKARTAVPSWELIPTRRQSNC